MVAKSGIPRFKKFRGKTVAAVIEFPDEKIILVKRNTVVFKGCWALPGGKVETGETIEQTVVREIKEETGLDIKIIRKIGIYHEKGVNNDIEYDYYPTCFKVKPITFKIKRKKNEIQQVKLFSIKNIPTDLAFSHSKMLQDYLNTKEIEKIEKKIRNCIDCRLHITRINAVPGEGTINTRIMMCGQAPGRNEDKTGHPFVGMAGKFLNNLLIIINMKKDQLYLTSPIKCFPPNNRLPKTDELKSCNHYLKEQISIIKPKLIVTLGNFALKVLLKKEIAISQIHGVLLKKKEFQIFPTFHPSAAMRFPKIKAFMEKDFKKLKKIIKNLK